MIERTRALGNRHEFWLALASAAIICGRLVHRAWTRSR
jgi:hypothetical protein